MDDQLSRLLNEYGQYYGKGAIMSAVIQEHAKELISSDALEKLVDCI